MAEAKKRTISIDDIKAQEAALVFASFTEEAAYAVGSAIVAAAKAASAPVVIDIRTPDRTLFHAALPGSTPDNDQWARRKSNSTLRFHQPSLLIGCLKEQKGEPISSDYGLDPLHYSAHGGSFPVRVAGVGVVAAITVSGLPQEDDHRMVVAALEAYLGKVS
ncbi:MAG: heme-degrading domain-containing protein [Ancalomicrobiaceae bacterium]|nr:heme-degrading domain-containing protein [Ancalomicrobiaceae bacterium]